MKYEINDEYARIRGCAPNDRAAGASSRFLGNTAQSPPEGFVLDMLAYFPSSCTEIP